MARSLMMAALSNRSKPMHGNRIARLSSLLRLSRVFLLQLGEEVLAPTARNLPGENSCLGKVEIVVIDR
jgi:hypothetical protein